MNIYMSEAKFERKVVKKMQQLGYLALKLNGPGHSGWPDRLFAKNGKVVFIEFKGANGRVSSPQKWKMQELTARGFYPLILRVPIGIVKACAQIEEELK